MTAQTYITPSGTSAMLSQALLKLVAVVEEENGALRQHKIGVHAGFTDRKNQALRELMAAQRCGPPGAAQQACQPLLRRLSRELAENARLLKLNISAVGEISDIIIGGLREAESDGTYGRGQGATRW